MVRIGYCACAGESLQVRGAYAGILFGGAALGDCALLHDATEAYCVDVPRPLKRLGGMNAYRSIEQGIWLAVAERSISAAAIFCTADSNARHPTVLLNRKFDHP